MKSLFEGQKAQNPRLDGQNTQKKSNKYRINLFIAILFFRDNVIQHQRGRINYRGL